MMFVVFGATQQGSHPAFIVRMCKVSRECRIQKLPRIRSLVIHESCYAALNLSLDPRMAVENQGGAQLVVIHSYW